jgi:SAM-dependent methyltransferase
VDRALSPPERDADAGYLKDVEYTGDFYDHLSPARLAYGALINGYAAPRLDGRFTWCELGCGKGVTALALAALHPKGEFHACDFNPPHIAYAEALRSAAGIGNLRLYAKSIGEMLRRDLPAFDFVVLHGVYSWVPEAVRGEIAEFLGSKLKPGGLAMVSYNAMPGWAHLLPLRRMMRAYGESVPGDSLDKARAAFAYVRGLANAKAGYFSALPAAAAHLESMARKDIRYIAHEYMTPHGDPFYFAEVEAAMRSAGLAFAGSMDAADNYPELMMPAGLRALLPAGHSRAALEAHRDAVLNTTFRRDLYAAQPIAARAGDLPLERFEGIEFCLANVPERLPMKVASGPLQFDLTRDAGRVRAVHTLLEAGPAGAAAIAGTAGGDAAFLIEQLVVSGHLSPCAPARVATGWLPLNSALVDAALGERQERVPLAAPAVCSATYSDAVNAAAIEAAARFDEEGAAASAVLARLRRHNHPVNRHDAEGAVRPASDAEVRTYAGAAWRSLRDPRSADGRLMRLLGILR